MKDTKLVRALKTLNKEEWKSFRKHLLSYTGAESEIFSLFSILQSKKSKLKELASPSEFKSKHFPKISQKAFFVMASKIYRNLEDWLAINEFKIEEYQRELFLIKALFRKGLIQEARAHADKLKSTLNSIEGLDLKTNKTLAEVDHILYYSVNKDSIETRNRLLLSLSENYTLAYKERSMLYKSELINRNIIYHIDYDSHIEMLNSSYMSIVDSGLTGLGNSISMFLSNRNPDDLNILINALLENKIRPESELEGLLVAYVFIGIRLAYGFDYFDRIENIRSFFNFQFKVESKRASGKISHARFHNAVDTLGNYLSMEQTLGFVDRWIGKIETPKQSETKDLAYSQIYFINRDFEKMRDYSTHIAFNNTGQKTRAWIHDLICQYVYRKENYDLVTHSLKAYKSYLRRNKKKYSTSFFNQSYNIALIIEKLIKNDFKPQEIKLEDYNKVFYKKWIAEEINRAKRK